MIFGYQETNPIAETEDNNNNLMTGVHAQPPALLLL